MLWNDATTGLMLADRTTGLMKSCACCPCIEWGIAALCKREYIDCPTGSPGPCINTVALDDSEECEIIKKAFLYGRQLNGVAWGDAYTPAANGSVAMSLYFDGELSGSITVPYLSGVPIVFEFSALAIDLNIGSHRIKVVAIFDGDTENPQERCACILVVEDDVARNLESRAILPWVIDRCVDEDYEITFVKGPFSSKEDAEYVNLTFGSILNEYGYTCRCLESGCGPGDDALNGYWDAEGNKGGEIWGQTWVCEREMTWHIDWNVAGGLVRLESSDGAVLWDSSSGPSDIIIPPCTTVEFKLEDHSGAGVCAINVYSEGANPPPPCSFCTNAEFESERDWCQYHLEDNPGKWLSDWHYTYAGSGGPHGVPAKSAELADYLGSLEV